MAQCTGIVLAVERRRAGERQSLEVVGVDLQCLCDQPRRFALQAAAVGHGQCVRIVREQHRVVGAQLKRLLERRHGLIVAAEHCVGTPKHSPPVSIFGSLLQARDQLFDHGFDLRRRDGVAGAGLRGLGLCRHRFRVQTLRRAEQPIAADGDEADEGSQTEQQRLR